MIIRSTEQLLARLDVLDKTADEQVAAVAAWLEENDPDPELVYDLTLTGRLPKGWPRR